MSTYTRPNKTVSGDGTTSFVAGKTLPASELNTEMDNLVNHINGSLDEDNLDAGTHLAGIEKVLESDEDNSNGNDHGQSDGEGKGLTEGE